jgi:hypothetical protein
MCQPTSTLKSVIKNVLLHQFCVLKVFIFLKSSFEDGIFEENQLFAHTKHESEKSTNIIFNTPWQLKKRLISFLRRNLFLKQRCAKFGLAGILAYFIRNRRDAFKSRKVNSRVTRLWQNSHNVVSSGEVTYLFWKLHRLKSKSNFVKNPAKLFQSGKLQWFYKHFIHTLKVKPDLSKSYKTLQK